MAHNILKDSVEAQTNRASVKILGILLGGLLVVLSYVADWVFGAYTTAAGQNVYSDSLALLGTLLLGAPIMAHAVKHFGHGHMDELVALAIIAAIASQDYKAAGAVAFFLLLANLIETKTALGARQSIESLVRLAPKKASRVQAGKEELVDPLQLKTDDIVRVRPGDNIPADGIILAGQSSVNQANITGESLPVDKAVGDEVFSGTNNLSGAMDVRVTRAGEDTTLGKVRHLILQAEKSRIPMMRLIDRYAAWYTPTILMVVAAVVYFAHKGTGMSAAVTMLVLACPCAIILAVPTAMVAALSCAARLGILIKDVSALETARTLTGFIFDKTGTLTTGELSVTRMMPAPSVEAVELLSAAASAENLSRHPVARAVVAVAEKARVPMVRPIDFEEIPGKGVRAHIDGQTILVGRATWLVEQGINLDVMKDPKFAEPEGLSTLYVVKGDRLLGWIGLEDRTRDQAKVALDELRQLGMKELVMVTGDRWSVARRVAREMGCTEVQAEVLPADKLDIVAAMKNKGRKVAVVGDGVNDAPALAAGDLSIAMGAAGSDVAINSANIALMNNDLRRLPFLIKLSRRTISVIHQNLIFGVVFIVITETLTILQSAQAVGGNITFMSPIVAAVLHMVAATLVIFNSARLVRFGEEMNLSMPKEAPHEPHKPRLEHVAVPATATA
jgi:Cd2+/Zn2+-exporting ATPase